MLNREFFIPDLSQIILAHTKLSIRCGLKPPTSSSNKAF